MCFFSGIYLKLVNNTEKQNGMPNSSEVALWCNAGVPIIISSVTLGLWIDGKRTNIFIEVFLKSARKFLVPFVNLDFYFIPTAKLTTTSVYHEMKHLFLKRES